MVSVKDDGGPDWVTAVERSGRCVEGKPTAPDNGLEWGDERKRGTEDDI